MTYLTLWDHSLFSRDDEVEHFSQGSRKRSLEKSSVEKPSKKRRVKPRENKPKKRKRDEDVRTFPPSKKSKSDGLSDDVSSENSKTIIVGEICDDFRDMIQKFKYRNRIYDLMGSFRGLYIKLLSEELKQIKEIEDWQDCIGSQFGHLLFVQNWKFLGRDNFEEWSIFSKVTVKIA